MEIETLVGAAYWPGHRWPGRFQIPLPSNQKGVDTQMRNLKASFPSLARWAASALCALVALLGAVQIADGRGLSAHSFFFVPLWAALCWGSCRFFALADRPPSRRFFGFALAFVFLTAMGYQMQHRQGIGGGAGLALVGYTALAFTPCAAYLACLLYQACLWVGRLPVHGGTSTRKVFWVYAAVLLACWLPVFLSYYPGLFAYDANNQLSQVIGGEYSTLHPLLHTLLLGGFYQLGGLLGSRTTGMALYTLAQLVVFCLILSYVLLYLYRQRCPRALRVFCLLFFALCPIHPMLGISMTKDTPYAFFYLLLMVLLHQAFLDPEKLKSKKFLLAFLGAIILVCLLRNNGVIAIGFLCVTAFFMLLKRPKFRNRLLAALLCGLALFGASSFALTKAVGARPGPIREALSVPLQQVSRVYFNHKSELDCAKEIEEFIPGVYAYVPTIADPVKAFANVGTGNLVDFLKLWGRLLLQYPEEYVEAFLFTGQGYWFVDDLSQASHYGVGLKNRQGYLLTDTKKGFDIEHSSLFPGLENLYENLFSANEYQKLPIIATVFSLAAYTWLLIFLCLAAAHRKRPDILLGCMALVGALSGVLLGPCALVRYQYPLILGCPILFSLLFGTKKEAPLPARSDP